VDKREIMDNRTVLKILKSTATVEEKNEFFSKCDANQDYKNEFIRLKQLWTIAVEEHAENKKILFEQFWLRKNKPKHIKVKQILFDIGKYAAAVIVAIGLTFMLINKLADSDNNHMVQSFSSEKGSISCIDLLDGSKIWLNSGTKLTFVEQSDEKVVATLSGEGYFDIVHNPKREFLIDAEGVRVRDMGTSFNIKAYQHDDQVTATLIDGKIEIQCEQGASFISMKPNDHLIINKFTNKYQVEQIDPKLIASWREGVIVFEGADIYDVVEKLEERYNVAIEISSSQNWDSFKLTAMFKYESIIQVLDIISYINEIHYQVDTSKTDKGKTQIILEKN